MGSQSTPERFVAVYMQRGGDLGAIASDLGVGKPSVAQRAKKMRQAGIKLPIKRRAYNKYDIKALNNLIKEYKNNA
jgi:biotin operon repressor